MEFGCFTKAEVEFLEKQEADHGNINDQLQLAEVESTFDE